MHDRTHSPHKLIAPRMKDNDKSFLIMGMNLIFFLQCFLSFFPRIFLTLQPTKWVAHFFYFVWYTTTSSRIFNKLSKIYYSPQGYWKGFAAIKKFAQAAKVSEDVAQNWLMKQALWQVYLPAPRYIPRPKFDVPVPNKVHQADLLYLPHDRPPRSRKTFKYALTVLNVASRYKEAEPLTTKEAKEVAAALERIYTRGPFFAETASG